MTILQEIAEIWKLEFEKQIAVIGLANSNLSKSVEVTTTADSISISLPDYAQYVDSGRKPNSKQPPIRPLINWLKRKGITGDLNSIAFAIAKTIARRGIRARPFIAEASSNAEIQTSIYLDKKLEEQITKILG